VSDHQPGEQGTIVSVGALVTRGDGLLVVRPTYGPTRGQYSLPGGFLDPGEELHTAAQREVAEETGVTARPLGIVGLRSRTADGKGQADVIWLLEHVAGTPAPQSAECDDCRFMPLAEIAQRDDVVELVKLLADRWAAGMLKILRPVGENTDDGGDAPPETWRLFL
jgi:ADP-ribose pyrophosphatase YjhB (NUDIX family)